MPSNAEATIKEGLHQIGEVAGRLGLSLRTVRFYEEAGLVRPSHRSDGGFRLYGDEEIARLALIKQMKPLGFSIQEMRQLLEDRDCLAAGDVEANAFQRAHERLSTFAAEARAKCEKLRTQLDAAEGFVAELETDLTQHPARSAGGS